MTIVEILVKASLLLTVGALAHVLLARRTSAAARHLLWTFAIIGLLLLPVLSMVVPGWIAVDVAATAGASNIQSAASAVTRLAMELTSDVSTVSAGASVGQSGGGR